jgi:hypothetical protein
LGRIQASVGDAQRRVDLTHLSLLPTAIDFAENTGGGVSLELPVGDFDNDVIKQHGDMLRIINHVVVDQGPLGLADSLP